MQSSFNNRRIVVFSGNAFTDMQGLLNDIRKFVMEEVMALLLGEILSKTKR